MNQRAIACLLWLKGEVERGPVESQYLAREVHVAISNGTDDVSDAAVAWLGVMACDASRWRRQARACLEQLDENRPRDTVECPMFLEEQAS